MTDAPSQNNRATFEADGVDTVRRKLHTGAYLDEVERIQAEAWLAARDQQDALARVSGAQLWLRAAMLLALGIALAVLVGLLARITGQ